MDDSRLSSSGYKPQSDTRSSHDSSVPELADDKSIQVLSTSDSEDKLTDHNEDEARQDAGSQPEVVSMLDRLRPPILLDLARKRKVQSNPPVGMKRSKKGSNSALILLQNLRCREERDPQDVVYGCTKRRSMRALISPLECNRQ